MEKKSKSKVFQVLLTKPTSNQTLKGIIWIFKNYTKGIANLFGIGLGIATAAVTGPGIASAADPGIMAAEEKITNSRPIEH